MYSESIDSAITYIYTLQFYAFWFCNKQIKHSRWDYPQSIKIDFYDKLFDSIYDYFDNDVVGAPSIMTRDNIHIAKEQILNCREISFNRQPL